jgi:hypothetical protein
MTQEELQLSKGGQYYVSSAKTFTAADKISYLVVNANATFSAITDTDGNNVLTQSNLTSSVELKTGMIIAAQSGAYLAQVTPASGDCFCIKNR